MFLLVSKTNSRRWVNWFFWCNWNSTARHRNAQNEESKNQFLDVAWPIYCRDEPFNFSLQCWKANHTQCSKPTVDLRLGIIKKNIKDKIWILQICRRQELEKLVYLEKLNNHWWFTFLKIVVVRFIFSFWKFFSKVSFFLCSFFAA